MTEVPSNHEPAAKKDPLLVGTYTEIFRNCVRLASKGEPLHAQNILEFTNAINSGIIPRTQKVGKRISGRVDSTNGRTTYVSIDALTFSHDALVAENIGDPGSVDVQEGKYEAMIYISFSNADPQREHDSEVSMHLEFNNNAIKIYMHEGLETPEEDPIIADLCAEWGLPTIAAGKEKPYVTNKDGVKVLQKLESLQPTDFISEEEE